MKISYNWLKQYIDTDLSPEEVANRLTLLGLEVEGSEPFGNGMDGVVVGEILEVNSHPNADKLKLCRVDLGDHEVQIVCGADNVRSGQKVPVATTGSVLPVPGPDGKRFNIRKTKLRGELSEGMICAEDELNLGDDHSGIMVLDKEYKAGTQLSDALQIKPDTVFEIALTPNRPDASCHVGVARDLAAWLDRKIKHPYPEEPDPAVKQDLQLPVTIHDRSQCHRYVARIIRNVTVGPSPHWLRNRLRSIGLRPINNVVDVTNYVLHELGQPLHAFDLDLLSGPAIDVRSLSNEITFRTLDKVERNVPAGTLFICDSEKPVAIAGIMGGLNSEVSDGTRTVLLESAWFHPPSIRKTSKKLALQTDSSYRFERGVDPELTHKAAARAAELIAELSGGELLPEYTDCHPVKPPRNQVQLRPQKLNGLLGTSLETVEISDLLNRLDIPSGIVNGGVIQSEIPGFRPDISREADLIEEVGRLYDYNRIPKPTSTPFFTPGELSGKEIFKERIRTFSARLGYKEIATDSLLSRDEASLFSDEEQQIHTLNPVSAEATTLRTTLAAGFLKSVQYNVNRNANRLKFFEIGHAFRKKMNKGTWIDGIEEHTWLLFGLWGDRKEEDWRGGPEPFTIFDLKQDIESLIHLIGLSDKTERVTENRDCILYKLNGKTFARIEVMAPKLSNKYDLERPVMIAETDLDVIIESSLLPGSRRFTPVPKFPSFSYDAAFIVDNDINSGELTECIQEHAGSILQNIEVFDIYEGDNLGRGKKSVAFRLTFLDRVKTLNIKDVEPEVNRVVKALKSKFGARLRS